MPLNNTNTQIDEVEMDDDTFKLSSIFKSNSTNRIYKTELMNPP